MLPKHGEISLTSRGFYVAALVAAAALLAFNFYRLVVTPLPLHWSLALVSLAGMIAADFLSGLVHWGADTWGRESLPVLGPRFLQPFRVHHVNPDDFLQRRFIDTNGDVALAILPFLAAASALPLDSSWGVACAVFLVALSAVGVLTNQAHQWAHMPKPPALVRFLQNCRLLLGRDAHSRHHGPPYTANYCITTGWCNRPLAVVEFFPRLERAITRLTGLQPRQDDAHFQVAAQARLRALQSTGERSNVR